MSPCPRYAELEVMGIISVHGGLSIELKLPLNPWN